MVDVRKSAEQGFEVVFEGIVRCDGAEHICDHRTAEVHTLRVGLVRVNPWMRCPFWFCRAYGQNLVPDTAMMAAKVAETAEHKEPGCEDGRLQAKVLCDSLFDGRIGQIHIDVGHIAEWQDLQNHPGWRIGIAVGRSEMLDEVFFGSGVLFVDDIHQFGESVEGLVVGRIRDPEDVSGFCGNEIGEHTANGNLDSLDLTEQERAKCRIERIHLQHFVETGRRLIYMALFWDFEQRIEVGAETIVTNMGQTGGGKRLIGDLQAS